MSFSSVGYFHILATICLLSSLSALSLAKRRHKSKESGGTEHLPTKSSSDLVKSASCGGSSDPILTPSFIQPCYLYSRRAMMFLQILPSGKINGTNSYNSRYAELVMEVVATCMVRIRGEATKRYLVMEENGTLVSEAEPADETKSVFTYEIQRDFYTFKNGNYFIGFRQVGKLKRISATENGRNVKKNKRFVYVPRGGSRKRRDPSEERPRRSAVGRRSGNLFGDDLQ